MNRPIMNYQAVLFDLDGTLLDTLDDLTDAANAALVEVGYAAHDASFYKHAVGDGVEMLIRRALPSDAAEDDDIVQRTMQAMGRHYHLCWDRKTRPYDGIADMLDNLHEKGLRMAILSNKPDAFTHKCVDKLLPDWSFDRIYGARESIPRKPDPTAALEIAREMDVPPAQWLYLGDTNTDMRTACSAGMYAVGVLWGFRTADELREHGAQALLTHPQELSSIL